MTRSLYLLGQVAQAGHPVVAVATMVDVSEKDGQKYPVDKLADELGIPVLAVDPRHYDNPDLLEGIVRHALEHHARPKGLPVNAADGSCTCGCGGLTQADELFAWVDRVETAVVGKAEGDPILSTSDKIDRVLLNPWLGIPIFFVLMWFLFKIAGEWVSPVQDFFDHIFSSTDEGFPSLANGITYLLTLGGLQDGWLHSFLIGGLCTGLGVVSSFIPLMFIIFLLISILEDSGYMARAAFLMDRIMHRIGLHGKSFIPMLMGFGCNVPAIMATRTIESHSSRLITILIDPFMSCSARLPVYILLVGTFFSATAGTVLISLYAFGILMAALTAVLLRRGVFKADETPFVMELPPYRMPTVRATLKHMWDKAEQYMRKIGGVILVISIIIWFLSYYPRTEVPTDTTLDPVALSEMQYENSFLGRIGKFCQPLVAPMDFNWKATVALLSGAAAKEVIVSTLGVLYSNADEASLSGTLAASGDFTQRSALAFLIFILLYCPCIASLAAIGNETGSRKWVAFSLLYNTGVAGLFLSA